MTLHLESEVVASSFDPINQIGTYTIARAGKRYTAVVPMADLEKYKGAAPAVKAARRAHIAAALQTALLGEPDAPPQKPEVEHG